MIAELTAQLANGVWVPGERLPSLTDLCAELDVSRSTMR
ncbi:MAG: GntR family transcriptional regulator [Actinobacteria bacterium]|nr:GntR family transcriptional regulator [Actinomycetota bacterium]